jgi:hypothetical protein
LFVETLTVAKLLGNVLLRLWDVKFHRHVQKMRHWTCFERRVPVSQNVANDQSKN